MDEPSFLVLSPLGSSRGLFENGYTHVDDPAMVREVKMFRHRKTTPLVSCVVTETLHLMEMLTKPVREPATIFANVHGMTAVRCDYIDYTGRSAVEPILKSNTSASGRYYVRFTSEGACKCGTSIFRKEKFRLVLARVRAETRKNCEPTCLED